MEQGIKDNADIGIQKFQNSILRKVGVESSYWKALRAKRVAMTKIRDQDEKEYTQLWDYCETLRSTNPGTKVLLRKLYLSDPPVFERMFFSLKGMRMGFLEGCRPLIGLDGCFLKTPHGGQLLCAVGRDGNDNLFPIALAVVPIENREMWTWFLSELLDVIGGAEDGKWTFISDRQKGLLETIKEIAPRCPHRFCVRHIYQNFKQKWTSLELKQLLWRAASTGNTNEFQQHLRAIERIDAGAAKWLREIEPYHWCRAYFRRGCNSDVVVNNLCESFNNFILQAREKPIVSMFEWIRARLTTRIQVKREGMEKYEGQICPNILKKINKYEKYARNCFPRWCGGDEFEVEAYTDRYVVHLDKRTCTCGMFQLNGYPCPHAWTCILDRRLKVEDYVDHCYSKSMYLKAYSHMVHAVPGPRDYIITSHEPLLPPMYKKKAGRPKRLRRKAPDEIHRTSTRRGLTHTCKNCLQQGHNRASCKNPTNPASKFYKGNSSGEPNVQTTSAPTAQTTSAPRGQTTSAPRGQTTSAPRAQTSSATRGQTTSAPRKSTTPSNPSAQRNFTAPRSQSTSVAPSTERMAQANAETTAAAPISTQESGVGLERAQQPSTIGKVYVGRRNATLLGGSSSNPIANKRIRKPEISQVLQNIRENAKRRRQWKP
ncbi:PREDICTED: uncharacterized protein LOC105962952 [Erythranthe guttata]|uniref:uncharacterized protein LOC105962952 n=1 Tax=Erythranthe guttata TaxID=4155 RepID=UPI00064E06E6|nr:PREDICTED: uncharacterized protein LOC105962952 [Erythranthe guttata]|eukprot:XP_012842750.1 PREDICTED: uncharacterized protein LOC105962952 [Erythranthe guttata]